MYKRVQRFVVGFCLFVVLGTAPVTFAGVRDRDRDGQFPAKIVRVLKNLQKFFGISPNETYPVPPRP